MSTRPKMSFKQGSKVRVWDSTRLPAVVVHPDRMDRIIVRVEHGVTFTANTANLLPRDPACQHKRPPSFRQGLLPDGAPALQR
jgi:hypothetical protein